MARPSRGSGHTLTILQLLSMAALCEAHHFNKQIEVLRGRPTQPIMASIKFSRSLLLLVALIKCSLTSEINRKITKYSNTHIISKILFPHSIHWYIHLYLIYFSSYFSSIHVLHLYTHLIHYYYTTQLI